MSRAPVARLLAVNAVVAALYAVLGAATLLLGTLSGLAAPVWPAAGVAVAFALAYGWRAAPGIALGSFLANGVTLANVGIEASDLVVQASAVAVGAAVQALVARGLVWRYVDQWHDLVTPRAIVRFLLLAGPVASLVNPTVGVASQLATGIIGIDQAGITWITWWVGDSIGVIVFAPLTLMAMPGLADAWRGRRWKIAVPSLFIVVAFVLSVLQTATLERDRVELRLEQVTAEATSDLRRNLDRHTEALQGVKGLLVASDEVTADEFAAYTDGILARFPDLQAMSWNPVVPAEDLDAFIAYQRRQPGLEEFTVTERDAAGELQEVSPRPEYVVVGYIEPIEANRAALGFDIGSNPARVEAIARARDTGLPAATAPIELVQETGTQAGMLALLPVYAGGRDPGEPSARRAGILGFAVGVYRLGDLLADTYAGASWDPYRIRLLDVTDAEAPVVIADLAPRDTPVVDRAADEPLVLSSPFDAYGRSWELELTPVSAVSTEAAGGVSPVLLLAGLLLVFLLEAFVLLLTGLERVARREAEASSYEASHDLLTGLLNRRAFLRQVDGILRRVDPDSGGHVLLFMDLDGFKAVNDTGGHEAGDTLLTDVAAAMREQVRTRDALARMGGDEFAVLLVDCPLERGLQIADAIVASVDGLSVRAGGADLRVGVSVGAVAVESDGAVSVDELLRRADDACYEAKRTGRGHVRTYSA